MFFIYFYGETKKILSLNFKTLHVSCTGKKKSLCVTLVFFVMSLHKLAVAVVSF